MELDGEFPRIQKCFYKPLFVTFSIGNNIYVLRSSFLMISCFPIMASKAKNEWSHFVFDYQQQFEDEKRSNFEYF